MGLGLGLGVRVRCWGRVEDDGRLAEGGLAQQDALRGEAGEVDGGSADAHVQRSAVELHTARVRNRVRVRGRGRIRVKVRVRVRVRVRVKPSCMR